MNATQDIGLEARSKKPHLSELMRLKSDDIKGDGVNVCPYGCSKEDLDEHGYCDHLIGFATPTKLEHDSGKLPSMYEPMERRGEGRVVVGFKSEGGKRIPNLQPVKRGDKLMRISTSYRVYRDVSAPAPEQPKRVVTAAIE